MKVSQFFKKQKNDSDNWETQLGKKPTVLEYDRGTLLRVAELKTVYTVETPYWNRLSATGWNGLAG